MSAITAKELHLKTKAVLNQVERGQSMLITRNGRTIGRIEPVNLPKQPAWDDLMAEVWQAQKAIKRKDRSANPVIEERRRRRR